MQNNLNKQAKQNGFTLLELMISLALGVILLAALATVYMNAARSGAQREVNETLDQTARTVFDIFGHDFALAGFVDEFDNGQSKINDYLTYNQSKKELTVKYQAAAQNANASLYTASQLSGNSNPIIKDKIKNSGYGYDCVGTMIKNNQTQITNIYKFDESNHRLECKGSNENGAGKFYALVDGVYGLSFRFLIGEKKVNTQTINSTSTTSPNITWEYPDYQKKVKKDHCSEVRRGGVLVPEVKKCLDPDSTSIGSQGYYVFLTPKLASGAIGTNTSTTTTNTQNSYSDKFTNTTDKSKDTIAVEVCVVVASDAGKSYSANKYAEFQPIIPSCDRSNNGNDFVTGKARSSGDNKLYRRYVSVFNVPNSNFYKTDLATTATKGKK